MVEAGCYRWWELVVIGSNLINHATELRTVQLAAAESRSLILQFQPPHPPELHTQWALGFIPSRNMPGICLY